jgi:hypothetical protein
MLFTERGLLWEVDGRDWLAGGDFSDKILGLDTISDLGVAGSLLSGMIRPFFGARAATVGYVCGLGAGLLLPLVGPLGIPPQGLRQIGAGYEGTKAAVAGTGGLASEEIVELLIFFDESKTDEVAGARSPSQSICIFLGS